MNRPLALVRRLGWGLGDQVLSSLTNFALTVAVAREVAPREFGVFSTTIVGFILVLVVVRGLTTDTMLTQFSGARRAELPRAAQAVLATNLLAGLALGAVLVVVGLVVPAGLGHALVALGVVLPGLLLQDGVRFVAFAAGTPRVAFLNDLAWAVLQLTAVVIATTRGGESASVLLLLWGASGTACGLVGLVQVRVLPRPRLVLAWCREHWVVWRYYVPENALMNGTNLVTVAAVSAIAGFAETASMRVAVSVFGPLAVVSLGARAVLIPEFVRLAERDAKKLYRWAVVVSFGLAGLGLLWGGLCLLAPLDVGRALFGESWPAARRILPLVMVDSVANLFVIGCFIGMRATGQAHRGFRSRLLLAVPRVGVAVLGARLAGAQGAATGFAALAPLQVAVWSWQLRRAVTEPRVAGLGTDLEPPPATDGTTVR